MDIIELRKNSILIQKEATIKAFSNLEKTLTFLREIKLSEASIKKINYKINLINSFQGSERKFRNKLLIQKHNIIELVRKKHGYVPEKYYQNQWFVLGMSVFGLPLGFIFSTAIDNMAFLGVFLIPGMLIGAMIGKQKDVKAKREGKQINLSCN